jgi:hypothetical protein
MINDYKPGTRLGPEKPLDKPPRIGRHYTPIPNKLREEVRIGDKYVPCPGCGHTYNMTMRRCCPNCACSSKKGS